MKFIIDFKTNNLSKDYKKFDLLHKVLLLK